MKNIVKSKGTWSNKAIQKEINKLYEKKDGKYAPYCMASIQYLKKKLK